MQWIDGGTYRATIRVVPRTRSGAGIEIVREDAMVFGVELKRIRPPSHEEWIPVLTATGERHRFTTAELAQRYIRFMFPLVPRDRVRIVEVTR